MLTDVAIKVILSWVSILGLVVASIPKWSSWFVGEMKLTARDNVTSINALALFKDGRKIASGCDNATISVWDIEEKSLTLLVPPEGEYLGPVKSRGTIYDSVVGQSPPTVRSLVFEKTGRFLIAGCGDGTIRIWDVEEKKQTRMIKLPITEKAGRSNSIFGVAISKDGKTIASASSDGTIRLWSYESGKLIREMDTQTKITYSVSFSPDGKRLASSSADKIVRIWNTEKAIMEIVLKGHTDDTVWGVVFSPDGQLLASCAGNMHREEPSSELKLWDAKSGKHLADLTGHKWPVHAIAFSPNGKVLVSAGGNAYRRIGEVISWDVTKRKQLSRIGKHESIILAISVASDGRRLATSGAGRTVGIWELPKSARSDE